MTLSTDLQEIALAISIVAPDHAAKLRTLADVLETREFEFRRMERTLNEIVENAQIDAELTDRWFRGGTMQ